MLKLTAALPHHRVLALSLPIKVSNVWLSLKIWLFSSIRNRISGQLTLTILGFGLDKTFRIEYTYVGGSNRYFNKLLDQIDNWLNMKDFWSHFPFAEIYISKLSGHHFLTSMRFYVLLNCLWNQIMFECPNKKCLCSYWKK